MGEARNEEANLLSPLSGKHSEGVQIRFYQPYRDPKVFPAAGHGSRFLSPRENQHMARGKPSNLNTRISTKIISLLLYIV